MPISRLCTTCVRQKRMTSGKCTKSPDLDVPNGLLEMLQACQAQPDFPTLTVGRYTPTRAAKNRQDYRNPHCPLRKIHPESWINQLAGLGTMLKECCSTADQLHSPETFKVKGRRKEIWAMQISLSSKFNGMVARKEHSSFAVLSRAL